MAQRQSQGARVARCGNARPVIRILAVGDSYTAGEGVPEGQSWPRRLERHPPVPGSDTTVTVVARTGWTASEARAALAEAAPSPPFDAVTVQVGVNDQYRGGTPEEFRSDLRLLFDDAIRFAGGDPARVVFVSIPDWSVTPFAAGRDRTAVASEIDAHNEAARETAAAIGARFVDVTTESRAAARSDALVADDGLHPSPEMHRRWMPAIRSAIQDALARSAATHTPG
jgi:lysophospholipase L1-like esterase